jgi:hypothetical protein
MKVLKLLSIKHHFLSYQGFLAAVVKTLLVFASICIFAQSSIFPRETERLPLEVMLK